MLLGVGRELHSQWAPSVRDTPVSTLLAAPLQRDRGTCHQAPAECLAQVPSVQHTPPPCRIKLTYGRSAGPPGSSSALRNSSSIGCVAQGCQAGSSTGRSTRVPSLPEALLDTPQTHSLSREICSDGRREGAWTDDASSRHVRPDRGVGSLGFSLRRGLTLFNASHRQPTITSRPPPIDTTAVQASYSDHALFQAGLSLIDPLHLYNHPLSTSSSPTSLSLLSSSYVLMSLTTSERFSTVSFVPDTAD
ncbi:hypothetical protein QBC47DRAFT_185124 [Echria macrotheca]|uniref:Uncharacterized protein n=1 Tax=Echria macrotheca TaxID=438768 RepID=A0AAJ0BFN8_9PEZI|nr:hypothetical protein QBC47DRAFT_185124 [Echria macrotheca]